MSKPTYHAANVAVSNTSFAGWIDRTNQIVYDMATVVVTVGSVAQPNSTNGAESSGNAHIDGMFSANTLIANEELRGGTVSGSGQLNITSNTDFANSALVVISAPTANFNILAANTLFSSNTLFDGAEHRIHSANTTITTGNLDISAVTTQTANVHIDGTILDVTANTTVIAANVSLMVDETTIGIDGTDTLVVEALTITNANSVLGGANVHVTANATFDGAEANFNNNVTLGAQITDTITLGGRVDSDVLPLTTNISDLGSLAQTWAELHVMDAIVYDDLTVHDDIIYTGSVEGVFRVDSTNATFVDYIFRLTNTIDPDVDVMRLTDTALEPGANVGIDLGSLPMMWKTVYSANAVINDLVSTTTFTAEGNAVVEGNLIVLGDTTLSTNSVLALEESSINNLDVIGTLSMLGTAKVDTNFVPSVDATHDIGSITNAWNTVYATTLIGSLDWSNVANKPDPNVTVNITGDVSGSGNTTLTDLANGTINIVSTIDPGAISLTLDDVTGNGATTTNAITVGGMTVNGNLDVSGVINRTSVEEIHLADNYIILNADFTGTPTVNAGITVERGTETNRSIFYDEVSNRWSFDNDGTIFPVPTPGEYGIYTWALRVDGVERGLVEADEKVAFVAGTDMTVGYSTTNDNTITFNHDDTSTLSGDYGQTGTENGVYIKSVSVDGRGHMSAVTTGDFDTRFLAIGATAVDSHLLDGLDSTQFIRTDAQTNVSGNTEWQDGFSARFGNSQDMALYHNGTNSFIELRTGDLEITNFATNKITIGRTTGNITTVGKIEAQNGNSKFLADTAGEAALIVAKPLDETSAVPVLIVAGDGEASDVLFDARANATGTAVDHGNTANSVDSVFKIKGNGDVEMFHATANTLNVDSTVDFNGAFNAVSAIFSGTITTANVVASNDIQALHLLSVATNPTVTMNSTGTDIGARLSTNADSFLVRLDTNNDGDYGSEQNALVLDNGDSSLSIFGGTRVFADDYHPNADKWTTARTLTLSGDVSGSTSIDGSSNKTLSVTVANDSHNHSSSSGNFTVNGKLTASSDLDSDGNIVGNIIATQAQAEGGTNTTKIMTPQRTKQYVNEVITKGTGWRIVGNRLECWGTATATKPQVISFPQTFSGTPTVIAGTMERAGNRGAHAYNASATGVTVTVQNNDGDDSDFDVGWLAIGTPA